MECPCRWCNDRTPNCHGVCDKYKEWDQLNKEAREKRSKILNQNRIVDEQLIMNRIRRKKK